MCSSSQEELKRAILSFTLHFVWLKREKNSKDSSVAMLKSAVCSVKEGQFFFNLFCEGGPRSKFSE